MQHDSCLTKVSIRPEEVASFAKWQAKLYRIVSTQKGFLSLEILAPHPPHTAEWQIIERFYSFEDAMIWQNSDERDLLLKELTPIAEEVKANLMEPRTGGITEVFVTQVAPSKKEEYKQWIAKIHEVEATFEGFQSVYVQAPTSSLAKNWLTMLQFDTKEHLDKWLASQERKKLLEEAKQLIESLESHRVSSGYSGWFSRLAKEEMLPPVWKQTCLVLLVLYPIVMLQILFLNPHLTWLKEPVAMFICNAISVSLISYPMMPIAIYFLRWWLITDSTRVTVIGTFVLLLLYAIEVLLFTV